MTKAQRMTGTGQRIILTLWVGGLWTVGYIVAPMLFQTLDDRRLAGEVAGKLFTVINYIGLVCGVLLLIAGLQQAAGQWRRAWRVWVLVAMLLFTAVIQFGVQPLIQTLKAATPQGFVPGSTAAAQFGALHGVSSVLFLVISLLGLGLVIFGLNGEEER